MNFFLEKADIDDVESEKTAAQVKSAIRAVFVVSALSLHSAIEGDNNSISSLSSPNIWSAGFDKLKLNISAQGNF